jgi:DNA-binding transcriptional regulator YiaG
VQALEKQASRGPKPTPKVATDSESKHRFSAKWLATHRQRLGLSAAGYGALLRVSALTVYKWEGGQARPRDRYLPAIAAAKGLGKREAAARLEQVAR